MSLQSLYQNQRTAISNAIQQALKNAFKNCSKEGEPQLIANLVFYLTHKSFTTTIRSIFKNSGIKVYSGAVFVHKQPQVEFNKSGCPTSVEIGDLLLLVTHKNVSGIKRYFLLIQAKKFNNVRRPQKPGNSDQHYLYAFWPEFKYVRSTKKLNGQLRQVTPHQPHDGAKYFLIGCNNSVNSYDNSQKKY